MRCAQVWAQGSPGYARTQLRFDAPYASLKNKTAKEKAHRSGPQHQNASDDLIATAAKNAKDREQVGKDVVDVEVNRQGRRHVVRLAAVHNTLQIDQHEG